VVLLEVGQHEKEGSYLSRVRYYIRWWCP